MYTNYFCYLLLSAAGLCRPASRYPPQPAAYDRAADELAEKFVQNFSRYATFANAEILAGAPLVAAAA